MRGEDEVTCGQQGGQSIHWFWLGGRESKENGFCFCSWIYKPSRSVLRLQNWCEVRTAEPEPSSPVCWHSLFSSLYSSRFNKQTTCLCRASRRHTHTNTCTHAHKHTCMNEYDQGWSSRRCVCVCVCVCSTFARTRQCDGQCGEDNSERIAQWERLPVSWCWCWRLLSAGCLHSLCIWVCVPPDNPVYVSWIYKLSEGQDCECVCVCVWESQWVCILNNIRPTDLTVSVIEVAPVRLLSVS